MCKEDELETGFKVVAIMQTITEEHDESSKRMWRKILGLPDSSANEKEGTMSEESE
jgi:hypothetical protein